jgi:hypothetical protein
VFSTVAKRLLAIIARLPVRTDPALPSHVTLLKEIDLLGM